MVNELEGPWEELCLSFQRWEDRIEGIIQELWDWTLQVLGWCTLLPSTSLQRCIISHTHTPGFL